VEFQQDIKSFLSDLEWASINLKREIKTLDDRIGKTDSNGITILPININKKATWSGEEKLKDQLDTLNKLVNQNTNPDEVNSSTLTGLSESEI
jgi:mediator of RNA polymerase II transcription subunit 11